MNLFHAPEYSIRLVTPPSSDTIPKSEVIAAGVPTGKIVDGAVFEAALRWNDHVLLFLTDDVPFEEGLDIYLLDANLDVVDSAKMCVMYSTGIFSDLDLTQPDAVGFRFFGGIVWTLTLFPEKKFSLPIISGTWGVSRPFAFFHRFQISGHPLPETSQAETKL